MARRRRSPAYLEAFKAEVMRKEGYAVDVNRPETVKYSVADARGIPLRENGRNGQLTTENAGKVGGPIGGAMVREMIRMAQEKLASTPPTR